MVREDDDSPSSKNILLVFSHSPTCAIVGVQCTIRRTTASAMHVQLLFSRARCSEEAA